MDAEHLTISGKLGPLGRLEGDVALDLRPFTLLIGVQGVGKSLLSQFLYFFRDAPYLVPKYYRVSKAQSIEASVAWVVEGLRAGTATSRSLASLALTPTARFEHRFGGVERKLSIYQNRSPRVNPHKGFREEIDAWLQLPIEEIPLPQAVFVPDERTYYSRVFNTRPTSLGDSAVLPIPMLEFASVLETGAGVALQWQREESTKPQGVMRIEDWAQEALRGRAQVAERGPYAKRWVWQPLGSDNVLDIEMASSGQKEAWPLVVALKALFTADDLVIQRPVSVYVEEPESHLHPAAQVAVLKMLVYLVQQGFRVVVTTHSLTVLYALNNLMLGYRRDRTILDEPELALDPELVSAYHLKTDGAVENLLDRDLGFIDEVALGTMNDRLATEFYRFAGY